MDTIISSIISGFVAIAVCVISQAVQSSKTRALIEYRIGELEKKVDKHNQVIDRVYHLEETSAIQEVRLSSLERSKK